MTGLLDGEFSICGKDAADTRDIGGESVSNDAIVCLESGRCAGTDDTEGDWRTADLVEIVGLRVTGYDALRIDAVGETDGRGAGGGGTGE